MKSVGFVIAGALLLASLLFAFRQEQQGPVRPDVEPGPGGAFVTAAKSVHPLSPSATPGHLLLTGIALSGRDRSPLAGAEVRVADGPVVTTDDGGRFALPYAPDPGRLYVRAKGFSPIAVSFPEGRKEVEILLERTARLHGLVTRESDGEPVAGARVWATATDHDSNLRDGPSVVTDARGRYELPEISGSSVRVFVRGGGWVSPGLATGPEILSLAPGATLTRSLTVESAGRISGRVVHADGRPARARVTAHSFTPDIRHGVTSDEGGNFVMEDLIPGVEYGLYATGDETADGNGSPVVPRSGETVEARVTLPPPRFIDLVVLERGTGTPIAGAEVRCFGLGQPSKAHSTDSRGRARIGPLAPGSLSIEVRHPDYLHMPEKLQFDAAHVGELRIQLEKGYRISGRAVLPDGTAPPDGWGEVYAEAEQGGWSRGGEYLNGIFETVSLKAGRYEVIVETGMDDNDEWWEGSVLAAAGDTDVVVPLHQAGEAGPPTVALSVQVLDPFGHPVPAASLRVITTTADEREMKTGEVLFGHCELRLMRGPGTRTIEVFAARSTTSRPLPFAAKLVGPIPTTKESVTITLEPGRRISGRVCDQEGVGIPDLTVAVAALNEQGGTISRHGLVQTAPDGSFMVGGLWDGKYQVEVHIPREYLTRTAERIVPAGTEGIRIELERGLKGSVTLIDPAGEPVAGASLELLLEDEDEPSGLSARPHPAASGVSGEDGAVALDGLQAGATYLADLVPPKGRIDLLQTYRRHVRPGEALTFDPGFCVTATITDPGEADLAGLVVWGRRTDRGGWRKGRLIDDGEYRVGPFPESEVALLVVPRGTEANRWGGVEQVVPAGSQGVQLSFRSGRDLVVRVLPRPENGGKIHGTLTLLESDVARYANADAEGVIRFKDVPPGLSAVLWIQPRGDVPTDRYARKTLRTGEQAEMTVELVTGRTIHGRIEVPCEMRPGLYVEGSGFRISGKVANDGTFELRGVPPGEWKVSASCCVLRDGHRHSSGEAVIKGDGPVVIRMSDPR